MWFFSIIAFGVLLVVVSHYVLPEKALWLSSERFGKLKILVALAFGTLMSSYIQTIRSKGNDRN